MMSEFFTGPEFLQDQAQPIEIAALIWSVPDKGVLCCLFVLVQSVGKLYSSRPGWQTHFDNPLIKKNKIFGTGIAKNLAEKMVGREKPATRFMEQSEWTNRQNYIKAC